MAPLAGRRLDGAVAVAASIAQRVLAKRCDRGDELVELLVGLGAAALDRAADAVRWCGPSSSFSATPVERPADGGDLGDDVDAVGLVGDHPTQPADLALDPRQAPQQRLLVVDVAGCCRSLLPSYTSGGMERGQRLGVVSIAAVTTALADLQLHSCGKVREMYEIDDDLLMVASDRISAYDVVMPTRSPTRARC